MPHRAGPSRARTDLATFAAERLERAARTLQAQRGGVVEGDAVAVHRARVALRRLRGELRLHRVFDRSRTRPIADEARAVARLLGEVRDRDVMAARVAERAAALPSLDRVAIDLVLARLRDERADAARVLALAVTSDRYDELVDALLAACADPPLHPRADPRAPARDAVGTSVRRALRQDRRAARRMRRSADPTELHALRKSVKRTRYGAEALHQLTGKRRHRELVRELTKAQDELGARVDDTVLRSWLRAEAESSDDVLLGYALGLLHGPDVGPLPTRMLLERVLRRLEPHVDQR